MRLPYHLGLAAAAIALLCSCTRNKSVEVMPITGSFIQMSHDDERYDNMTFVDESLNTVPEMWVEKIHALHEIGIEYVIFPQVAVDGKAYYRSKIMPHHFPEGSRGPVEAIMDTCDELGMKVFLSVGWCRNQYDNIRDSSVVRMSCEIMADLAGIFGDRPSFYGWYLPIEDCVVPYFPETSVPGINYLVAQARKLTPGKKTLISPWGLYVAGLDNKKFTENLKAVDADIIAFQDEVGCVREPFPLAREKRNLRKLGKICKELGMEYWVNCESFTWDRGLNNHYSTLIPAHFGRFLSQMVAASETGPARLISFAFPGIYEKRGDQYPLGQGEASHVAYETYKAWLEGDPKLKFLEDILAGRARNDARGCRLSYSENGLPSRELSKGQDFLWRLTDGRVGDETPTDEEWIQFCRCFDITLDLGRAKNVEAVAPHFLHYAPFGIKMPASLTMVTSVDGVSWSEPVTIDGPYVAPANTLHDCWTDISYFPNVGKARYIRLYADSQFFTKINIDEIFVKTK